MFHGAIQNSSGLTLAWPPCTPAVYLYQHLYKGKGKVCIARNRRPIIKLLQALPIIWNHTVLAPTRHR